MRLVCSLVVSGAVILAAKGLALISVDSNNMDLNTKSLSMLSRYGQTFRKIIKATSGTGFDSAGCGHNNDYFNMYRYKFVLKSVLIVFGGILLYRFVNRDSLIGVIERGLPRQEAELVAGIVWGKNIEDWRLWQNLSGAGLAHAVVASGANLMILTRFLVERAAFRVGRRWSIVAGWMGIWWYAGLTGWQIPILRAGFLMFLLYLGQLFGRKFNVWRALGITVVVMLLIDWQMVYSTSFWLSLIAFVGIVIGEKNKEEGIRKNIKEAMWMGWWLTPMLAWRFGEISWIGPIINGLTAEILAVVLMVGMVGSVVGLVFEWGGRVILWLAWPGVKAILIVVETVGEWGWMKIRFNLMMMVGVYVVMGWWIWRRRRKNEN